MTRTKKYIVLTALTFTIVLFIYSLFRRLMHVDDVILAEPTYWLAKGGYLRSEGLRGWQFAEEKFLFTHKLYVYVGALFINIFGWSSAAVKSVSLAYLGVLYIVAYRVFQYFKVDRTYFYVFALLLLASAHVFELGFVFRPEIAVATCMLGCYFLLQNFLDKKQWSYLIGAGIIAALGIGNHLNGVIIPGAGCLLLIFHRRFGAMLVFGIIASLGFSFQLLGVTNSHELQLMFNQFSHMQDIQGEHFSMFHYLLNIPNEQQRYLHSPREIGFTILILPILILCRKALWERYHSLLIYTLSGALCLAVIAHGKDTKYLTLLIPLYLTMTVFLLPEMLKYYKKTAYVLLGLYFVTETVFNVQLAIAKEYRSEAYQTAVGEIPEGSRLLTPVYASYWATPKYRMQWFFAYKIRASHNDFQINIQALNQELDRFNIDYVVFDQEEYDIYQPSVENMPKFNLKNHDVANGLWVFERKR